MSCCSAAAKGGTKKGKTVVGVLNLIDPGGSACKTNKPLQSRTSDFETDQRVLTKTLLYQNDASFSKDTIFNTRQTGRQQTPSHPESKALSVNATSAATCCWIQISFPPSFTLSVSPDSFFGKMLPFSWGLHVQQGTGSSYIRSTGRIFCPSSVVCGDCKWTAGGSTEHQMPSPAGLVPAAGRNGTQCLKVTPDWKWEGRKWVFWTRFTPMRSNPGNHLASKLS